MKSRMIVPGTVHHVFQQTLGGVLLFYDTSDYLVFFTLYCATARRMGIRVLALCPMPDHLHQVVVVKDARQLSDFVRTYSRGFALEWNHSRGRKGPLFRHPYGVSAKRSHKAVRTTLAYVNNNPVERKLTLRAEDYRWTFLSYYQNPHPYSVPTGCVNRLPTVLRNILHQADACRRRGGYVSYSMLDHWLAQLEGPQLQLLCDYLISSWNAIDYEGAVAYYGSMDTLLEAFRNNTGSEHEIQEEKDPYSDAVYAECSQLLSRYGCINSLREIPMLDSSRKAALYRLLRSRTAARPRQIQKLLHI